MSGLNYEIDNSDYGRAQRIEATSLPWAATLETRIQDSWVHNPNEAAGDFTSYYLADHPEWRDSAARVATDIKSIPIAGSAASVLLYGPLNAAQESINTPPKADELIDAHSLNQQYGQSLGLSFDKPQRRGAVDILVKQKKDQLQRDYVLAHAPSGISYTAANLATSLAVSAADPLNIAAAFVPVVPEARAALWAERYGATAARIGEGAVSGAVGTGAIQPIESTRDIAFQQEYGPYDAFLNVAFGSVLGGGLHAGFGKVSDLLGKLHPETREAALRSAVAQTAEGRPVDVEAALKSDPAFTTATESRPLTSLPIIDEQGISLASREAELQAEIKGFQENLSALPKGDQAASDSLARLQAVEQRLASPDIESAERKALQTRRDELLTSTTPEGLQSKAAPLEQRRTIQNQLDASQRELDGIRVQQHSRAIDDLVQTLSPAAQEKLKSYGFESTLTLGPEQEAPRGIPQIDAGQEPQPQGLEGGAGAVRQATGAREVPRDFENALARTRQDSLSPKPSTATSPDASASADASVKAGDDIDAELEIAREQIDAYEKQGILTPAQAEAARAGSEDIKRAQRDGNAAKATARCLLLHP